MKYTWSVPPELFRSVDREFRFTTDVCAPGAVAFCPNYMQHHHALDERWSGRVWCNPPYVNVDAWLRKAIEERDRSGVTTVFLLPVRTDAAWWHDYVMPFADEVRLYRGRIRYGKGHRPRFGSCLVIYRAPICMSQPVPSHGWGTRLPRPVLTSTDVPAGCR